MEHLITDHSYLALFAACVISSLGIPIGSELAIGYAGALASGALGPPHLHIAWVIVVAVAGELVGSGIGYGIGRFGGRPLVDRVGKYLLLTHRDLDRAEGWLARRGEPFVLFGRLIPLVRSFVSLAAGLGEMTIGKFVVFTVIGSAVFTSALAGAGDALGSTWHHVVKDFSYAGYAALGIAVLAIALAFAHRIKVVRAERDEERAAQMARPAPPSPAPGGDA